jgi:hypothetical protein
MRSKLYVTFTLYNVTLHAGSLRNMICIENQNFVTSSHFSTTDFKKSILKTIHSIVEIVENSEQRWQLNQS